MQCASRRQTSLTAAKPLLVKHALMSAAVFEAAVHLKGFVTSYAQLSQCCLMYASCSC